MAAGDQQVAVIERSRLDPHHYLRRQRHWVRAFTATQAIEAAAAGNDFIGAHGDLHVLFAGRRRRSAFILKFTRSDPEAPVGLTERRLVYASFDG